MYTKEAASLVVQRVKCLPAMRETRVQSLGWEDPLEKEMGTHSSTLAWKISWMEVRILLVIRQNVCMLGCVLHFFEAQFILFSSLFLRFDIN